MAPGPTSGTKRDVEEVKGLLANLLAKLQENVSGKTKLGYLNQLIDLSVHAEQPLSVFTSVAAFIKTMRPFVCYKSKAMRITALRVLRFYMKESEYIKQMNENSMPYFVAWSMEKDKQPDRERIQAMKLAKKIGEVDASLMPRAIVQALVSTAEAREDPLSRTALQILCDLAVKNPKIVSMSNGLRTLCASVVYLTPMNENIQDALLTAILYLLSEESTRKYINLNDIRLIYSPLTDVYDLEVGDKVERWRAAKRAVVFMLKSWTGLFVLSYDSIGLRSVVEALRQPVLELNEIVLDALFEIFRIAMPKKDPFAQSKKTEKKTDTGSVDLSPEPLPPRFQNTRHNVLDNFTAILLFAFINNGLIQALIDLGNEMRNESKDDTDGTSSQKQTMALRCTVLFGELLYLSNTHLPTTQCAKLQTLPTLVNQSVSFTLDPRLRSRASTMITYLYQYSHIKGSQAEQATSSIGPQKWRKKGKGRRLARVEEVKMKMDYKMDEQTFQQKLRETNVLITKDYQKWKWDLIADLLRGPLTNPAHVASAFKTKFIKRLLSFLRPSNGLFSNIPNQANNIKYARIACMLLEVLVSVESGQQYLTDNRLVPQIAEYLNKEIQYETSNKPQNTTPTKSKDVRLFSKEKILRTMAIHYFSLIGTLSSSPAGLDILNKHKVFDQLSPMSVLPGRDDLHHPIMTSLDYNMAGPSRVLLAKSLTSTSKVVRYLATRHLGYLLRSGATSFPEWGIILLFKQLGDEHGKIVMEALMLLEEACDDIECIESLITRKPALGLDDKQDEKVIAKGKEIMIRLLSRNSGFQYLSTETKLIPTELKAWREHDYINYVLNLEKNVQASLHTIMWKQKANSDDAVYLPPHFYGELAQTARGCDVLKQSGHFPEFVKILQDEKETSLKRRAALWVIGQVGKSTTGLAFLIEAKIIPYIVELARKSCDLNLKGTCIYVFGLLSKTEQGKEILARSGWESAPELNVCVPEPSPENIKRFFEIDTSGFVGYWPQFAPQQVIPSLAKENPLSEVLQYIGNLSNHITTDSASRNLRRLKTKEADLFRNKELIVYTLRFLEVYKYRLQVRQFIYSLLEIPSFKDADFPLFNTLKN